MIAFLSDQVSQFLKALGLNLSMKRETNIKKFLEEVWGKLIDSIVKKKGSYEPR